MIAILLTGGYYVGRIENRAMQPKIVSEHYHNASPQEINELREKYAQGKIPLILNETQLYLYLNQMDKKYSFRIKWIQNISIIGIIATVVFIFINWKLTPILLISTIIIGIYNRKLARKYILNQCASDNVFFRFALAVGLVKLQ